MTTRFEKIKSRLFDKEYVTKKLWWGKGSTILTTDDVRREPLIVRKALAMEHVMRHMPIEIKPDELIVGISNMAMVGFGHVFPEYSLEEEKRSAAKQMYNELSVWGHHPVDYKTLLECGAKEFRARATEKLRQQLANQNPRDDAVNLYRAMIIALNALCDFAHRYSALALDEAIKEKDPTRRTELVEISEICLRVPEEPSRTLHEALQSFWLTYIVFHSCLEYIPAGRSDQYLYPFYERDVDRGILTKERATELITSWLAKFSERVQIRPEQWENHLTFGDFSQGGDSTTENAVLRIPSTYVHDTSANHWLMNIILAGLTRDGRDATNEMTYIILDCWARLEAIMPVLSVRFHRASPDRLYEECAKIVRHGSGEPAMYNDEQIVKGLTDLGIPIEDARDYSNDGCWETLIPGKSDYSYAHLEVLQMLEYVLFRGQSLIRGQVESEDFGDPLYFSNFEDLYSAFKKHLWNRIDYLIAHKIKYYGEVAKIAPDPLLSAMMDDCIERGKPFSNGGAKYVIHGLIIAGLSNCVDSLASIKKLVFEQQVISMNELLRALETNFEGNERLRQLLINEAPKFGNDDDYVDTIAVRILDDAAARVMEHQKNLDWLYIPLGIGTFENYLRFGLVVGASADGRRAQESVSSNYSPSISVGKNGPTAAICSSTKANLLAYCNGCPLDIYLNPNEVRGEDGINRVSALIKSFMELGGVILTITGVNSAMLQEARTKPDLYRGLRVRLGGFSAYFTALPEKHQEIMIDKMRAR
ncbi:MAG: pyruvate formate lyase family protein [Desulforhabdus sp.]|jgi:formate C-acetyltransferase|nr:pyruvate formate lyase family protein [Desulforhabdus sp.]